MDIEDNYSCIPLAETAAWCKKSSSFGKRVAVVGVAILTIPASLIEGVVYLALAIFGGLATLFTAGKKEVKDFTIEMLKRVPISLIGMPIISVMLAINPNS